jgi:hypothetical protein
MVQTSVAKCRESGMGNRSRACVPEWRPGFKLAIGLLSIGVWIEYGGSTGTVLEPAAEDGCATRGRSPNLEQFLNRQDEAGQQ